MIIKRVSKTNLQVVNVQCPLVEFNQRPKQGKSQSQKRGVLVVVFFIAENPCQVTSHNFWTGKSLISRTGQADEHCWSLSTRDLWQDSA